jgi:hypothetical protein
MRNTLVAALSASILAGVSLVAIPSTAQSQVIIVAASAFPPQDHDKPHQGNRVQPSSR